MGWKSRRTSGRLSAGPNPRSAIKGRSSATEFFFQEPGTAPVILVCHISKTAGTALRRVVRANLAGAETEVVHNLRYVAKSPAERLHWFREWYAALDDDRKARLCCVMSHWAAYLLPALNRPVDALVLVREPVDRTLSYYFHKQRQHAEWSLAPLEQLAERRSSPDWRKAPEHDLLDRLFNNWQSRALLSVFHDVSTLEDAAAAPPEADVWRARLHDLVDRVFLVGIQDRFEQYVGLLARRYGWQELDVPHAKVNPQRPSNPAVSPSLRDTILAYNWLDLELYDRARQAQIESESERHG